MQGAMVRSPTVPAPAATRSASAAMVGGRTASTFGTADGAVAYVDTGRCWVAAGAPVARGAVRAAVAAAFVAAARAAGRRVVWFAVDARFAAARGGAMAHLGAEAWCRADRWPTTVAAVRSLRAQLQRARSHGVVVRPIAAERRADPRFAAAIAGLVRSWQLHHHLPPMRFLLEPTPLADDRLLFVAECGGRPVGLVALRCLPGRAAVVTEFVRAPSAPNGTGELLLDRAFAAATAQGQPRVALGLAPLRGPAPAVLRAVRLLARGLYDFRGLQRWKQKLRPQRWRDAWLAAEPRVATLRALHDVARAFAGEPLWRFALRTALRAPPALLRLFAIGLAPWLLLLAAVPGEWLPAPWVRYVWLGFDLLLLPLLLRLARRWRQPLGVLLAIAMTVDAVASLAQTALRWPHVGGGGRAWLSLGAAGAVLAALTLWGGVRRGRQRRRALRDLAWSA